VGDKVMIPGGDNFSKAITNLWGQHLFSNVQIYFTKLEGNKLFIEIHVTERPGLPTSPRDACSAASCPRRG
jgi:outer membrane protein insertion porin family